MVASWGVGAKAGGLNWGIMGIMRIRDLSWGIMGIVGSKVGYYGIKIDGALRALVGGLWIL